ncbi:MAG: hypothetical protein NTZ87_03220 [Candidatus Nomurabacteria bacterium]|nr:hypothetical protein [Candidatus Nomurabacteria bacterium]
MKKIIKFLIPVFVFLILIAPVISFAQADVWKGLVPPCSVDQITKQCVWGFNELMTLINTVIHFILFYMAIPIAAVMFVYAGFKMVTSGGSAEARGQAKNIFTNAVLGLVIAAAAWLIIRTILSILGFDGAWIGFTI